MKKLVNATFEIGKDKEIQEVSEKIDLKPFHELADLLEEKQIEHLELNMGFGKFVWDTYKWHYNEE